MNIFIFISTFEGIVSIVSSDYHVVTAISGSLALHSQNQPHMESAKDAVLLLLLLLLREATIFEHLFIMCQALCEVTKKLSHQEVK